MNTTSPAQNEREPRQKSSKRGTEYKKEKLRGIRRNSPSRTGLSLSLDLGLPSPAAFPLPLGFYITQGTAWMHTAPSRRHSDRQSEARSVDVDGDKTSQEAPADSSRQHLTHL